MTDKIVMLVALVITVIFLVILLINSIKEHQVAKSWFIAAVIVIDAIAWIFHFIKNFL